MIPNLGIKSFHCTHVKYMKKSIMPQDDGWQNYILLNSTYVFFSNYYFYAILQKMHNIVKWYNNINMNVIHNNIHMNIYEFYVQHSN